MKHFFVLMLALLSFQSFAQDQLSINIQPLELSNRVERYLQDHGISYNHSLNDGFDIPELYLSVIHSKGLFSGSCSITMKNHFTMTSRVQTNGHMKKIENCYMEVIKVIDQKLSEPADTF